MSFHLMQRVDLGKGSVEMVCKFLSLPLPQYHPEDTEGCGYYWIPGSSVKRICEAATQFIPDPYKDEWKEVNYWHILTIQVGQVLSAHATEYLYSHTHKAPKDWKERKKYLRKITKSYRVIFS